MSASHLAAGFGVLAVLGAFFWYVLRKHGRQQQEHAVKTMAARERALRAALRRGRPDGSHEALEMTSLDEVRAEFFERRYPHLGEQVER